MNKKVTPKECSHHLLPVRDALDVVSGKWKILILISISSGNNRFKEIENSVPQISPKVLAKELKDLEEHQLITREVHDDYPVRVEYKATEYSKSLNIVIEALRDWGMNHRKKIMKQDE